MIEPARARAYQAALLLFLACLPGTAVAELREVRAKVVWVGDDHVYIAFPGDSTAVRAEDRLTFVHRGKPIATGEVAAVHAGELAVATLTSGSLRKIKRLDRLRIRSERRALRPLRLLRVGYPSRQRPGLLFSCERMAVRDGFLRETGGALVPLGDAYGVVRDSLAADRSPWPDTLLVRLFDEATDEEIALERGELDAGVFWPGELSPHLRDDPRWRNDLYGLWASGLVAAIWDGSESPGDSTTALRPQRPDLAALNRLLFRGDLTPWSVAERAASDSLSVPEETPVWPDSARYAVDPRMPGHDALERFLNRRTAPDAPLVRLLYLEVPVREPVALRRALGDRGATPLFALRCPVVCRPELRPYLEAIGPDALVDLHDCSPGEGRR